MRVQITPTHRVPTEIKLHKVSAILEIHFDDESIYELPSEYLRVFTQSAEAVGHGPGQETLQIGKEDVTITDIQPVGNYAIKLVFSDGHDTGIYSWDLLYKLGSDFPLLWSNYLEELKAAGLSRRSPLHN
ncbi:gamma-butyrobetaine hydroxylase-like domain-containing protein [Methylomonas sp. 2BW1-5-20]|uniref:gamma-butyrobetaine hydroxylase-like domain-containing protein n=1 Tax=Methylomonas sp. 2BW1-5-20 TaxID=3376686 RepID=UPI00404D3962